jgi:alginate production protein
MHAIAPLKEKIETWTDVLGQVRWYFDRHSRIRGYVLLRKDSDEIRNREPVWWGVGFDGRMHRMIRTWMEIAVMRGTDKGRKLRSWAYDIGATFKPIDHRSAPFLTLAHARGSGDETGGDGIDNNFRQTGYEDNVDSFGGVITTRYYGEVLDPELSNLKILTLALGIRPLNVMSLEAVYHSYRQDQLDDRLRGDLIDPPARPNEISDDIGWELDFLVGVSKLWRRVNLSWVIAIFNPGKAFDPFLENAILNRLNLKIDL